MNWFLKFLLKLGVVSLLVFLAFKVFTANQQKPNDSFNYQPKVGFLSTSTNRIKGWGKDLAHRAKRFIYHEAEVHNPAGDALPDQWDDIFLDYLKKKFS
jgi:hypothetical protein